MSDNGGGECGGDDDEWGDLITTPNHRLISDEFFVLKSEEIDKCCYEDVDDVKSRRNVRVDEIRDVNCGLSDYNVWSQFVTTPSGISLESMLDSPILLPNSQGSPTDGTFPFPHLGHEILGMNSAIDDSSCDSNSFTYQQHGGPLLWPCISDLQNQQPVLSEFPGIFSKETVPKACATDLHSSEGFKVLKNTNNNSNGTTAKLSRTENQTSPMRNSEDGYNWRKYGQKQVKGSEYPRSYYKCTHPNCQVKKKVERSHDGHITEIIYKGSHNHQGQRHIIGSTDVNNISVCRTQDSMSADNNPDLISTNQGKCIFGNPEHLSSNTDYDINKEDETHVGILSDEADDDKSDLKRRNKVNCLLETSLVTRAMREPRVVVQIESEIDILDDGYRWRKYGQKVVKGNPNPRSYYKCTTPGCPVRKHVERASDDLKSVLTTYEGKHNHEIPLAKNSTLSQTKTSFGPTINTTNQSLSRIPNIPKPEPPHHFNRKLNNEFIPSNFTEPNSICPNKYVSFQNPLSFGSIIPDFPISPMSMPISPSANMVNHTGFGFNNNGKRPHEAQSYHGRYLKPKMEQDDGFYDTFMPPPDHVNNANSRYSHVIPRFMS